MRNLLIIAFLGLLAASCSSTKSVAYENLSELYRPAERSLEPQFTVYHTSDDSTTVYFRISNEDLLYARSSEDSEFMANIRIEYQIFMGYDSKNMLDSSHVSITHTRENSDPIYLYGSFKIASGLPTLQVARIKSYDLNRKTHVMNLIEIDRRTLHNEQHYLIVDESTGHPLFEPFIDAADTVEIITTKPGDLLNALRYDVPSSIAPPPFTSYYANTPSMSPSLTQAVQRSGNRFVFSPKERGVYFFTFDRQNPIGPTLYYFKPSFPSLGSYEDMVPPLRYLSSRKEHTKMIEAEDVKKEIDKFWLNAGRSPERAKELILSYYDRVQFANAEFSSIREGWATDRGMIYIIFGPPNVVYRNSTGESWVYGTEGNYLSFTYNFAKVKNPLSNNDFELSRSPSYKNYWYRSVDSWRQGRVSISN